MKVPEPRRFVLLVTRRILGIAAALYLFYVAAHYVWQLPFPTPLELVFILFVVVVGVALGIAFSRVWPLPEAKGFPRVIRTILLTIPALGFGIAIQVFFAGPRANRAYYVMFALAAWLGSGFIREEETDDEGPTFPLFGRRTLLEEEGDDGER